MNSVKSEAQRVAIEVLDFILCVDQLIAGMESSVDTGKMVELLCVSESGNQFIKAVEKWCGKIGL